MLDNREISVAVWLAIFLAWGLSRAEVRKAGVNVVRAFLAWKIVLCFSMMAVYIALTVLALRAVSIWDTCNLKGTVLWAFTAALVMVFEVGMEPKDERYFRKAVTNGFKVSVVLEFIMHLYVFGLAVELVFVPTATILACMIVIAESKDEFKAVRLFLDIILAVLGFSLLGYAVHGIYSDFRSFAQLSTLAEFFLPIMLTMLFLPFLYCQAVLASYETLFVRLQFFMSDAELRRFTKLQLVRRFGLNFWGLNHWGRRLARKRPSTREEVLASFSDSDAHGE